MFLFTLSIVNAAGTVNINNTTDGGIAKGIIDTETNGILNLDEGIYKGINNTNLTIDRNLTIIGKSRENTIIDGEGSNWVFNINGNYSVTFTNLTIKNAKKTENGAGIYSVSQQTLKIENCSFINNSGQYGGAIAFNDLLFGDLSIISSNFINNSAQIGYAIFFSKNVTGNINIKSTNFSDMKDISSGYGCIRFYSILGNLIIDQSNFTNIYSSTGPGGAIYIERNSIFNMSILNSNFTNISAYYGAILSITGPGAIGMVNNSYASYYFNVTGSNFINCTNRWDSSGGIFYIKDFIINELNIIESNFTNCSSIDRGYGGVLFVYKSIISKINIQSSNFTNNSAVYYGGVVCLYQSNITDYLIKSSIFIDNSVNYIGGALFSYATNITNVNISYCDFINNSAFIIDDESNGGAIFFYGGYINSININNSNFINNSAINGSAGGIGIYVSSLSNLYVYSSNFINNSAIDGGAIFANKGFITVNYNRFVNNSNVAIFVNGISNFDFNWWGDNFSCPDDLNISYYIIVNLTNKTSQVLGGVGEFSYVIGLNDSDYADFNPSLLPFFEVFCNSSITNLSFDARINNDSINISSSLNPSVFNFAVDNELFSFSLPFVDITNSTIVVSDVQVGDNAVITGQLANYTGISSVNVTVDGILYSDVVVDSTGGNWTVSHLTNHTGTYNVIVNYIESDTGNYTSFTNITSFTVLKNSTNSTIVVPSGVHVGDNAVITGQLDNYTGIGFVNVTVDGILYSDVVVDSNGGNWTVSHLTNHTGVYIVTVEYTGSDTGNYTSFTNTTSFTVLKNSTNSTIVVPSGVHVGDNAVITGQLDNYTGIGFVNVTVDGILYSDVVVDSNGGNWTVSHLTNHTGVYIVTVEYTGSDTGNYTSFTNTTSFEVNNKLATNSSINIPGSVKFNQTVLISGVLTDENNNTISGANLEVIVDGESFNVTTDSVGVWGLNYTPEHSGVFNLSLFYQGDSRYVGFVENKVFNVSKLATTSSINIPSNVKVGKSITVSGVLTSGGKPLANTSVLVIVDGKTYKVTTNGLGVWKLSYTLKKAGKSTMKVSFAGNNDYIGFNVSKTFKVTGKVKISIVKISKLVKVGKYRGFNLYSKVYTIKNVGSAVGSKDYVKYFKNWYLEKLSKTSKIVKYQFITKSRILKVQIKNLGIGKQVKIKILVTHRKRL